MLAYLVLEGARPLYRTHLAELLWDGYERESALASLRVTLSNLRSVLTPYNLLSVSRQRVQFQHGKCPLWCDALSLESTMYGLTDIDLTGIDLTCIDPTGIDPTGIDLTGANVTRADPNEQLAWPENMPEPLLLGFEEIDSLPFCNWLQEQRAYYENLRTRRLSTQETPAPTESQSAPPTSYPPPADPTTNPTSDPTTNPTADPASASFASAWGAVPDCGNFCGRELELATLARWVLAEKCRLVSIVGMGGQGKSALAAHFVRTGAVRPPSPAGMNGLRPVKKAQPKGIHGFDTVLWYSLFNAPPLRQVLTEWLDELSDEALPHPPPSLNRLFALLLQELQRRRCLLVLDDYESTMAAGERAGHYRPECQEYEHLLTWVGEHAHRSCLLVIGREEPAHLPSLEGGSSLIRTMRLYGLTPLDGKRVLQAQGLKGHTEQLYQLVDRYSGNPLALKLVAATIHNLFGGNIERFLAEGCESLVFDDIRDILDHQFERLMPEEQTVLNWLAIEREPLPFEDVCEHLVQSPSPRVVLETLRSLQRRTVLVQAGERVGLQAVIMEYVTERLVADICTAIEQGVSAPAAQLLDSALNQYALVRGGAKEQIRESQIRLLLKPVHEWLTGHCSRAAIVEHLRQMLRRLQQDAPLAPGYAAANLVHLLLYMGVDVRKEQLDRLTLQEVDWRSANLSLSELSGARSHRLALSNIEEP